MFFSILRRRTLATAGATFTAAVGGYTAFLPSEAEASSRVSDATAAGSAGDSTTAGGTSSNLPQYPPDMHVNQVTGYVTTSGGADETGPRKRVAVFGGSFNPITNAHLNCAAEIIHSKLADEVWITPCGARPDKPSLRTSGLHRLIMCHLAVDTSFGSRFGVKVCDEEIHQPRNVPSLILMRRLKANHPNIDFSFVVGSDLIPTLHEWDAPAMPGCWDGVRDAGRVFMSECNFLVVDRPGSDVETSRLPPNFKLIAPALKARGSQLTETYLSSSEVRQRMLGADDIVRFGLRRGDNQKGGDAEQPTQERRRRAQESRRAWYDEAEGLVPPSVLGHIVRYGLYAREAEDD
mmetsp:Transcript_37202/g.74365  ORF Transcript_37202/g.74365 Transcript_37202/m.74365 type:complete len:349 (-) Transcript_37202:268-1314(-)